MFNCIRGGAETAGILSCDSNVAKEAVTRKESMDYPEVKCLEFGITGNFVRGLVYRGPVFRLLFNVSGEDLIPSSLRCYDRLEVLDKEVETWLISLTHQRQGFQTWLSWAFGLSAGGRYRQPFFSSDRE